MRNIAREKANGKRTVLFSARTIRIVVQRQYNICGRLWSGHSPEITIAHTAQNDMQMEGLALHDIPTEKFHAFLIIKI